jgi:hypothetical protein
MTKRTTVVVACNTQRILFAIENNLRTRAKSEPELKWAIHWAQCSLLTQRTRWRHEYACAVCLHDSSGHVGRADQGLIN